MNTTATIHHISLADLHESPFNLRRTFRETGLQELASDIRHQGILSPLLVRPRVPALFAGTGDDNAQCGYELVFGHRRLRAAQLAELPTAPCMVRWMTDEEVKRAQISENLDAWLKAALANGKTLADFAVGQDKEVMDEAGAVGAGLVGEAAS